MNFGHLPYMKILPSTSQAKFQGGMGSFCGLASHCHRTSEELIREEMSHLALKLRLCSGQRTINNIMSPIAKESVISSILWKVLGRLLSPVRTGIRSDMVATFDRSFYGIGD